MQAARGRPAPGWPGQAAPGEHELCTAPARHNLIMKENVKCATTLGFDNFSANIVSLENPQEGIKHVIKSFCNMLPVCELTLWKKEDLEVGLMYKVTPE